MARHPLLNSIVSPLEANSFFLCEQLRGSRAQKFQRLIVQPLEIFLLYLHRAARCVVHSWSHRTGKKVHLHDCCTDISHTHTGLCHCTRGLCHSHPGTSSLDYPNLLACTHSADQRSPPGSYGKGTQKGGQTTNGIPGFSKPWKLPRFPSVRTHQAV